MSPGRPASHSTGFGLPVSESSKLGAWKVVPSGGLPPVALAPAQSPAGRPLSLPVATVNSLKPGFAAWLSFQKQPSALPSEVAIAGIERPLLVNTGSAPTSDGPKSDTITSIFGFLAISAVSTVWVSAGSQLVTSYGASLMNLYESSSTVFMPLSSSLPWLLPLGPLRNSRLPPPGRMLLIHLPQFSP